MNLGMGHLRRQTCRYIRRFLLTALVVVVTAAALIVLYGVTALEKAYQIPKSSWPRYSVADDKQSQPVLAGPGTVLMRVDGDEGLLDRFLNDRGVAREIITLDMTRPAATDINCFHSKTVPSFSVCPHPSAQDRHISNQLKEDGVWQPRTLALLPVALRHYPSSTLVDVGAHVGVFSLLGARLRSPVVAVEPVWTSAVHLHAGAVANNVSSWLRIFLHAVTRVPTQVKLKYKNGNLGGTSVMEVTPREADYIRSQGSHNLATSITLDSLAPFINTSVMILKVDTEGRECEAISGGRELLTSRFTPYIFMEWAVMANNRHKYHAPCRPHHLREIVKWLGSQGYHAHISKSGVTLMPSKVESWRAGDIYWRHTTAPPLHPSHK